MDSTGLGRLLLVVGLVVVVAGAVLALGGRLPFGQLPGDVTVRTSSVTVSFPVITCIVLSVVATVVLSIVLRR